MTAGHLVFVESNTTGTGAVAVDRLLAAGASVTFLARRPAMYPFLQAERPRLSVLPVETNDAEAVCGCLAEVRLKAEIDAVLTFSEFYVEIVAEAARRHGFRYLSPEAARTCRNKAETRRTLRAAGLRTPEFRLVRSPDEARRAARAAAYPCVVKPPADSSSRGVRLVRDEGELLAQFHLIHGWSSNDRGQPLAGEALVESLLDGPEVSVETVTLARGRTRIVGITAKHLSPPPSFAEVGHDFPAVLETKVARRVEAETQAALAAVGFDFGPAHTEIRLTEAGPVVVEINPRLAGGMIPELVRRARGIDLLAVYLDQLCGRQVDLTPASAEWASIRFFTAPGSGLLKAVHGLEAARSLPLVREVSITTQLPRAVRPAEDAFDRLGFVITSGASRGRVLSQAQEALRLVRFEIGPPAPATGAATGLDAERRELAGGKRPVDASPAPGG